MQLVTGGLMSDVLGRPTPEASAGRRVRMQVCERCGAVPREDAATWMALGSYIGASCAQAHETERQRAARERH